MKTKIFETTQKLSKSSPLKILGYTEIASEWAKEPYILLQSYRLAVSACMFSNTKIMSVYPACKSYDVNHDDVICEVMI